jgi:acyl dehydratase
LHVAVPDRDLAALIGVELGPSSWLDVPQARIDAFAETTLDRQWIHVDAERAAEGPFGGTVAHGFLTLSLSVAMLAEVLPQVGGLDGLVINYGLDRVRFPARVPAGSRVRGRFHVEDVTDVAGGSQIRVAATIEREGAEKPVCAAVFLLRVVG